MQLFLYANIPTFVIRLGYNSEDVIHYVTTSVGKIIMEVPLKRSDLCHMNGEQCALGKPLLS